MIKEGKFPEI